MPAQAGGGKAGGVVLPPARDVIPRAASLLVRAFAVC